MTPAAVAGVMRSIFIGILPFWLAMAVCLLAILVAVPQIAPVLHNSMFN